MNLSEQSVVDRANNGDGRNSGLSFDSNWVLKLRLLLLLRHAESINSDKLEEEYEEMWGCPMFKKEPTGHESVLKVLREHVSTKVRLHYVEQGHASANVSSVAFSRKDFEEFVKLFKRSESQQDSMSDLADISGFLEELLDQNSSTAHLSRSAETGRSIEALAKPVLKAICSSNPNGTSQETVSSHEGRILALGQLNAEQSTSAGILTAPNNMLFTLTRNEEVNQQTKTVPAGNSPMVPLCEAWDCRSECNVELNSRGRSTEESSLISADDESNRMRRGVSNCIPCESQTTCVEIPHCSSSNAIWTEAPKGNCPNLKRPCEGNQRGAKRKAVSSPPNLTPPWTSPADSDAGYSSCPVPGSSSERSVSGLSIDGQVNCRDPPLPTLENMSIQEIPNNHHQTTQKSQSPCIVAEMPSPYLEQNSEKEASRAPKRKRKNVSTSPAVVTGQSRIQFQAPKRIFSSFGDLDEKQVLGERMLKCGKSTSSSITNLEDWGYFVACRDGKHKHGLFIATEGFVYRWDKEWELVHGLMLPEGSVIYGDFNPNRNLFRIFDAVRLGKEKLDDFDYNKRKEACSSFVEEGPNTGTRLRVTDAESLEVDSFRKTLNRLHNTNGAQKILFIRCRHHKNSTFWSVMKHRLTWNCPSKTKLKNIIGKLPECDGGLEFTEFLLERW